MAARQRRYSKEELARRGQELYESQIKQQVEEGNEGRIVAIDIETGAFKVADCVLSAILMLNPGLSVLDIALFITLGQEV